MVSQTPVPLFYLLQLLTLFFGELASHLPMGVHKNLTNPSTCISPNISQLSSCFIDDRRNFRELLRGKIKLSTEPFFHPAADSFGMMQFKIVVPRI